MSMINEMSPASGNVVGSDGKIYNLVTLMGGGEPVSDTVYDVESFQPRSALILGEDGKAYDLVKLIQSGGAGGDLSDYVKKTDYISANKAGLVSFKGGYGLQLIGNYLLVEGASSASVKSGESPRSPITPSTQHEAVFFGLAKAAGVDEKDSSLPTGQYTSAAQDAIRKMLGVLSEHDADRFLVKSVIDIAGIGEVIKDSYLDGDCNGTVLHFKSWDISKYYPIEKGGVYELMKGATSAGSKYYAVYDADFNVVPLGADLSGTRYISSVNGYIRISQTSTLLNGSIFNRLSDFAIEIDQKTIPADSTAIANRDKGQYAITPSVLDYAVKTALCDKKGADWTEEEKKAAQERIGLIDSSGVMF